jgi:hypothetical protein
MANSSGRTAARQNKLLQRFEISIQTVQAVFDTLHLLICDNAVPGYTQLTTNIEQIMLDLDQFSGKIDWQLMAGQQANDAVQLINRSTGFNAQAVLVSTRTIAQTGRATVTCSGVYL